MTEQAETCTCGHSVAKKRYGHTWWVYNRDCAHVSVAVFPLVAEKSDAVEEVPDEGYCPQKGCGNRLSFLPDGTPVIERMVPRAALESACRTAAWMGGTECARCLHRPCGHSPKTKSCIELLVADALAAADREAAQSAAQGEDPCVSPD